VEFVDVGELLFCGLRGCTYNSFEFLFSDLGGGAMRSFRWGIVRPPLVTEFQRSSGGAGKAESISATGVAT
jgi:hypothetical protein